MQYNTIKDLENGLKSTTDINKLKQDLMFKSQGISYTCRFIGFGTAMGNKEAVWVADDSATNVRVVYSGEGTSISVSSITVNKF